MDADADNDEDEVDALVPEVFVETILPAPSKYRCPITVIG